MRLFVGNLALDTTDAELGGLFQRFTSVTSVNVMKNGSTGEGHGYGYVDMEDDDEANAAIGALQGSVLHDRELMVVRQRTLG
jgi:RNA recognition motif-containing protein